MIGFANGAIPRIVSYAGLPPSLKLRRARRVVARRSLGVDGTHVSIDHRKTHFSERWIAGSSPAMTEIARQRRHDYLRDAINCSLRGWDFTRAQPVLPVMRIVDKRPSRKAAAIARPSFRGPPTRLSRQNLEVTRLHPPTRLAGEATGPDARPPTPSCFGRTSASTRDTGRTGRRCTTAPDFYDCAGRTYQAPTPVRTRSGDR